MDYLKASRMLGAGMVALAMAWIPGVSPAQTDKVIQAAGAALRSERPQTAWDLLEPLEPQRSGERDFDLLLGMAAMAAGHTDRAIVAFERVLITDPSYAGARIELGRAYLGLGALDLARAEFTAALELEPPAPARRAIERFLDGMDNAYRRLLDWVLAHQGLTVAASVASLVAAGSVVAIVLLGVAFTLAVSWLLSRTVLKGEASAFTLELPPYRRPGLLRILYTIKQTYLGI